MKNSFVEMPDGYRETISEGTKAIGFLDRRLVRGRGSREENLPRLRDAMDEADAVIVGAGAGLSTSAGFTYGGERFMRYFSDLHREFGITDMYSGGFYPYPDPESRWAFWSRNIYFNRYVGGSKPVYEELASLLEGRDYFVVTTNVDHQFQRAGIDSKRLFCTQGDYGLFQSADGRDRRTFGNEDLVMRMMESQGFVRDGEGVFEIPSSGVRSRVPTELVPRHPDTGEELKMNLRCDDTFAEDDEWRMASARYSDFLMRHEGSKTLYLEMGVGSNTPVIIKLPFWYRTWRSPNATYACLNYGETYCPKEIADRSICIDGDLADTVHELVMLDGSKGTDRNPDTERCSHPESS